MPLTAPVFAPGVEGNSDKLFVVLTFSGGGKRAAAFSYGVLEALRDVQVTTPDGERRALLDEIDLISAVSGGAFTAAYYALHGHETFESYAPRFLNHDTEKDLWRKVLAPANWSRLAKPLVSRSDLEVEYFDEELFSGATVYDVMTRSPRVIITATDLVRAKPFAFTREQLNGVCVDPKSVPVARAVFASAATPIYFAPLVMRTFAGRCGYQPPEIASQPLESMKTSTDASAPSGCCRSSTAQLPVPAPGRRRIRRQSRRARDPRRGGARRYRSPMRCAATVFRARGACCSSWSMRAPASTGVTRRCPSRSASRRSWTRW